MVKECDQQAGSRGAVAGREKYVQNIDARCQKKLLRVIGRFFRIPERAGELKAKRREERQ